MQVKEEVVQVNGSSLAKGMSLGASLRHGEAFLALARWHEAALRSCGWTPKETQALAVEMEALKSLASEQLAARRAATSSTAAVKKQLLLSMLFRRRLYAALGHALTRGRAAVALKDFRAAEKGKNVEQSLAWLAKVRAPVAALDGVLQRGFMPESPLAKLDALHQALTTAVHAQEQAQRMAPAATSRLTAGRARVASLIAEMKLAAETAFVEQPEVLKQFRKRGPRAKRSAAPRPELQVAA